MVIKLYSIGIPATLNIALPSLLISALNAILAAYSEVYILVLGIYYKLQTFIYLPANGIVQGMRPLIGYNYGAGENKRVSQIYKIVLCMSGIIMVLGTVICLLIPGQLMGLFTHTEATIQTGKTALRIIGAGFIVSAVSVTSSGALEGLGKGIPSLLISLCRYVVVIIPTAFLLSSIFGAVGVWNAFWITEAITAIISICVYYKAISQSQRSQSTVKCTLLCAAVDNAISVLPEQAREEILRYYFLHQSQRVIGTCIGRSRSTAGRHIQIALRKLREEMERYRHE